MIIWQNRQRSQKKYRIGSNIQKGRKIRSFVKSSQKFKSFVELSQKLNSFVKWGQNLKITFSRSSCSLSYSAWKLEVALEALELASFNFLSNAVFSLFSFSNFFFESSSSFLVLRAKDFNFLFCSWRSECFCSIFSNSSTRIIRDFS